MEAKEEVDLSSFACLVLVTSKVSLGKSLSLTMRLNYAFVVF